MSLPVIIRPDAQVDLLNARDWYDRQRPGLGDVFEEAVEAFLDLIKVLPQLYAVTLRDVRQGKVKKFPYVVYYRVLANHIEVIAVLHGGRNPQAWQERS